MDIKIKTFIILVITVGLINGCIAVPTPPSQEVFRYESDINHLLDNSASRADVISKIGRPQREYESSISYKACRVGAGTAWVVWIPIITLPQDSIIHGVNRGDTTCFELKLYFDENDHFHRYEKLPFGDSFQEPQSDVLAPHPEIPEALPIIRSMAEKGFPESQWRLYNGYGRKPVDAIWLCRSADNGYAKAQYYVGRLYWHAANVPDNKSKAYVWYKLAATGDMLQGMISDVHTQAQAELSRQEAHNSLTVEQLELAETLHKKWKSGVCEIELLPVITSE